MRNPELDKKKSQIHSSKVTSIKILLDLAENDPDLGVWLPAAKTPKLQDKQVQIVAKRMSQIAMEEFVLFNGVKIRKDQAFILATIEEISNRLHEVDFLEIENGFKVQDNVVIALSISGHRIKDDEIDLCFEKINELETIKILYLQYFKSVALNLLKNLPQLEHMRISHMRRHFEPLAFDKHLSSVKKLELNRLKIADKLFQSVEGLINIEELLLKDINLKVLPESLTILSNLKKLRIISCDLERYPSFIHKFSPLEDVNIFKNNLTHIDFGPALGSSSNSALNSSLNSSLKTSLKLLSICENKIEVIPTSIGQFTNLKCLLLSNNLIKILPDEIFSLHSLIRLDLSRNKISSVPSKISTLGNLQNLDLSNNNLAIYPESINQCQNLSELNLSNNQIPALPKTLQNLTSLKLLFFTYNPMKKLPEFLPDLHLKLLDITDSGKYGLSDPMLHVFLEKLLMTSCELFLSGGTDPAMFSVWGWVDDVFNKRDWKTLTGLYFQIIINQINKWELAVMGLLEIYIIQKEYKRGEIFATGIRNRISDNYYLSFATLFLIILKFLQGKTDNIESKIKDFKKGWDNLSKAESNYSFDFINETIKDRLEPTQYHTIINLESFFS